MEVDSRMESGLSIPPIWFHGTSIPYQIGATIKLSFFNTAVILLDTRKMREPDVKQE